MIDYIKLLRPAQWIKNIFVFFALVFSDRRSDPSALIPAFAAFFAFCLLSSAVYCFNDLRDRKEDALHPTKKNRPLARGAISPASAVVLCGLLVFAGMGISYLLAMGRLDGPPVRLGFMTTAVTYILLNLFYSLGAKRVALLDVIIVALGFVLRALGGAQAIHVEVSAWLVICTFTLCLFLGFGKRRSEIAVMQAAGGEAVKHRATLAHYTPELLNQLLSTTAVLAVITFLLYTLDSHTAREFRALFFTTPLVLYAVFRYAMVIERGVHTGPTDILIGDRPFFLTCVVWTLLALAIVFYGNTMEKYLPELRWPGAASSESSDSHPGVSGAMLRGPAGGPHADAARPG